MPNELISPATQTESFAHSATLTQQRTHQENLDQGKDINSALFSELEIRELIETEEMFNDKFLLNSDLDIFNNYQFALFVALRNRGLISDKLYNFLFLKRKNQLIKEGKLAGKDITYFESFSMEEAETVERSFQNNLVYQEFLSEVIKRQLKIKLEVYSESCMPSTSNQAVTSTDKKTSDESSFLREVGPSLNSRALLIEINERKYEARIDCIAKIYVAANRIHLECKKSINISDESIQIFLNSIKEIIASYKKELGVNNVEPDSVILNFIDQTGNTEGINFKSKTAKDIIRLIELKEKNEVQNDGSYESNYPVSFEEIMRESLARKKDLSPEQKNAAKFQCVNYIYLLAQKGYNDIISGSSQAREIINEEYINQFLKKLINAIKEYKNSQKQSCELSEEKLISYFFIKKNNDIFFNLKRMLNRNGFCCYGEDRYILSNLNRKLQKSKEKKEKIISKFISQVKIYDPSKKDEFKYTLYNLNFYFKAKLVLRAIISRFIDDFESSNLDRIKDFKNQLIEANFFSAEDDHLEKNISKIVNKSLSDLNFDQKKEALEKILVNSKSFCKGRYFFNSIESFFSSNEDKKLFLSILPKIIKYEKEADKRGENLVATILKNVQGSQVNDENKSAAEAALKVFINDREILLFIKNILTGCDPKQTSVCINNPPLPVVPKEQEEAQSNPSEGLKTVINEPQPNTLEEQKVVVATQPSTPKVTRHLLCCFPSFFVREKGNTEQYELRSLNTVEDLSPSIPEQQETVVEVSQPSTSEQEERVELRKQEVAMTNLRPNTPAPEENKDKDPKSSIPENTVRSLLSRYKQNKPETKPEERNSSEDNSIEVASSFKVRI